MEPYNDHAYLEMDISRLNKRIEEIEDKLEKLDEVALILLPTGYKKAIYGYKRIEGVAEKDASGMEIYRDEFVCSMCGCRPISVNDLFCKNCGAEFHGYQIGEHANFGGVREDEAR